jgi:hypothetical protein
MVVCVVRALTERNALIYRPMVICVVPGALVVLYLKIQKRA